MSKISLMPEGFKTPNKSKILILSFISALLLGLAVLIFAGFFIWNLNLQNNLNHLDQEINSLPKLESLVSQNKINRLEALINNHVYWSEVFKLIEESSLKNIYFNNFSGDASAKEINLQSRVASYSLLAEQIKAFEQNFNKVDFSSQGMAKQGGIDISIKLQNVNLSKN